MCVVYICLYTYNVTYMLLYVTICCYMLPASFLVEKCPTVSASFVRLSRCFSTFERPRWKAGNSRLPRKKHKKNPGI